MGGGIVGLGFGGLYVLLFSPRVTLPFWLFSSFAVSLAIALGLLLRVTLDVALRSSFPVFAIIGGLTGAVVGGYYAFSLFRASLSR